MATSPERTFGQYLNTWVQTIGILIAAGWGVYTFIYKEVMLPKSAPVNITVNLQLKKVGTATSQMQEEKKRLIAVEMRVSATNPSPREIDLLPSVWIVFGNKVGAAWLESSAFAKLAVSSLNSHRGFYVEKHAAILANSVVATGSLFPDHVLKPNETATRTLVLHVPPGRYDFLEVVATMPTKAKRGRATLEWRFDEKSGSLIPALYRVSASGNREEVEKDSEGGYSDEYLELQSVTAMSALSLWQ